jgi:hypothetical protein
LIWVPGDEPTHRFYCGRKRPTVEIGIEGTADVIRRISINRKRASEFGGNGRASLPNRPSDNSVGRLLATATQKE